VLESWLEVLLLWVHEQHMFRSWAHKRDALMQVWGCASLHLAWP
jgi:hypothetical protein